MYSNQNSKRPAHRAGLLILSRMKILKLGIMLVFTTSINAQVVFNRVYKIGGNNLTELLVTDTGYISAAMNNQDIKQLDISEFDLLGNTVDTFFFSFDSVAKFPENCGKCLHSRENMIYYAQVHAERSDSSYIKFIKLNQQLDSTKSREYLFNDSLTSSIKAMAFDTDSTFIITGLVFKVPNNLGKWDLLVARFDTAFNLLWEKRIEDKKGIQPLGYVGTDIEVDTYGSIIVSGYAIYDGPNLGICARIDPVDGSVHWFKEFVGALSRGAMFTTDNKDGTYQYCQNDATALSPTGSVRYTSLRVGTMDTLGNILSFKDIGPKNQFLIQFDLIPTADGNFYTAGFTFRNGSYNSFGLKFAPNGDSLWMRYYHHGDVQDHSQLEIFFETPDSGFIHAGYYADLYQSAGPGVFTWLLKTDKYGCDSLGCHTVGQYEVNVPGLLEVFPNPSGDGHFYLQWLYGPQGQGFDLTVRDITGRAVHKEKVPLDEEKHLLDLAGRPRGVYLLQVAVEGKVLITKKLVVD